MNTNPCERLQNARAEACGATGWPSSSTRMRSGSGENDDDRLFVVVGGTRGRAGVGGLSLGNARARAGVTDGLLERSTRPRWLT